MNYAVIKKNDIANGPGVRVSLFVSGCRHHCRNCFNREAWDFSYGSPFTEETEEEILSALDYSYVTGLSLLGGEPLSRRTRKIFFILSAASGNASLKKPSGATQASPLKRIFSQVPLAIPRQSALFLLLWTCLWTAAL